MENRREGGRVNESREKDRGEDQAFKEFAGARPPDRPGGGSRFLRGCGIAIGIALLILAFVVGACFISFSR
jgi:hypothetical protein